MEYRRRRSGPAERSVVTKIDPAARDISFAGGQNRYGRVICVQTLSRHHMSLDQAPERIEYMADGSHRVGHRRKRDRHAFKSVTFRLTVQWLMLSELFEHDHRQKTRASPSPGQDMERGRRLGDLLTVTAR